MERTYIDISPKKTDGQKADEKMLNITHYREMQIKTTIRSEWPLLKSLQITDAGDSVEKREPSTVCGNVNWYSHCGEQDGGSPQNY